MEVVGKIVHQDININHQLQHVLKKVNVIFIIIKTVLIIAQ